MASNGFKEICRITIMLHHGLTPNALTLIEKIGVKSVLVESARTVRLFEKSSILDWMPWSNNTDDSPTDILRFTTPSDIGEKVLISLAKALELKTPGRGSIYAQTLMELGHREMHSIVAPDESVGTIFHDLTMITGIQTKNGRGEEISTVALQLGVGVPTVGIGKGTGVRDRLGLLRITISPEKELTYLMVPSYDANGLQNLLIKKGKLNKPGGGFIYQTPIRVGLADPLLRIGHQEHTASMEQVIAAIDELKAGTSWRKRQFDGDASHLPEKTNYTHKEISFICPADHSDDYVHAAMEVGAAGATMTSLHCIEFDKENAENNNTLYENAIMCVPQNLEEKVIEAILRVAEEKGETDWFIQSIPASSIYATYTKK